MAKYLLLKHYRGAPAPENNIPMDQWTPDEFETHVKFMHDFAARLQETGEFVNAEAVSPDGVWVRYDGHAVAPWPVLGLADSRARLPRLQRDTVHVFDVGVEGCRTASRGGLVAFAHQHDHGVAVSHFRVTRLAVRLAEDHPALEAECAFEELHRRADVLDGQVGVDIVHARRESARSTAHLRGGRGRRP